MALNTETIAAIAYICEKLSERTASLFLGAGINALILNDGGEPFPLGDNLAKMFCRDLLEDADLGMPLDDAAEFARHRHGSRVVNDYIYTHFNKFKPGVAHLAIAQLPWDVIYTTNYDLLVEKAFTFPAITAAGVLQVVVSHETDISHFVELDIPYYKLHGSMDVANTAEGRLILTKEDYRHYESSRKPLFKRLGKDLLSRTFLFVGYSLRDANFRGMLDDCRQVLGASTLPLSYAVVREVKPIESAFWREKYNIQLLVADSVEFLTALKDNWFGNFGSVVSPADRKVRESILVEDTVRFPKVTDSFYRVRPEDCTGPSNAVRFFQGAEPSWNDIRDQIPPQRDLYQTLFEAIFDELSDPKQAPSVYLVTGPAGTGKTTLLYSVAYDAAKEFNVTVLVHVPGTPLDVRSIAPLINPDDPQRIVIVMRHAAEVVRSLSFFIADAKKKKLPITVLLEERQNQWLVASQSVRDMPTVTEFHLSALSLEEMDQILDALATHGALGALTGTTREEQILHFEKLAEMDLLVALRELTSTDSFDKIIKDEYTKIPSVKAQKAYLYVSALGQIDLPIRYATLNRLMELKWEQLRNEIFLPAEGILMSLEESGTARHSKGFRIRARHPVIASIIFGWQAPDDDTKLQIINGILTELDAGYPEDARVLQEIVRGRKLVNTLTSPENRRGVYERLATILPHNPYVLQHRSILERELGNPETSIKFAREAVKMQGSNTALQNTLGMALEHAARNSSERMRRQSLLSEANLIFTEQVRRNRTDAYSQLGLINVKKQYRDQEASSERRAILQAEILSLLHEAADATNESSIITAELATQQQAMGETAEAMNVLVTGLQRKPEEERLRDLLISLKTKNREYAEAQKIAIDGLSYNPTSWRFHRHVARLKAKNGDSHESIKGHYESAIRHKKGDLPLLVEFGAYLYRHGDDEYKKVFGEAQSLPLPASDKRIERESWYDESTGRKRRFTGRVQSLYAATGMVMSMPDNYLAQFMRTDRKTSTLRAGEIVDFFISFNARGAVARII